MVASDFVKKTVRNIISRILVFMRSGTDRKDWKEVQRKHKLPEGKTYELEVLVEGEPIGLRRGFVINGMSLRMLDLDAEPIFNGDCKIRAEAQTLLDCVMGRSWKMLPNGDEGWIDFGFEEAWAWDELDIRDSKSYSFSDMKWVLKEMMEDVLPELRKRLRGIGIPDRLY